MLPRSLIRQLKWTRRADLSTPKTMSGVASSSRPLPVLTLYTKEDCSLCDEAVEALKPLSQRFQLETVDITLEENKEWYRKYRFDIPVFHLNGRFLMKHRANKELLHKKLVEIENDLL